MEPRMKTPCLVALTVGSFLFSSLSFAEFQEIHLCDEVAAHIQDKQRWGKGVTDEEVAPARAISVCTAAIEEHPDTPRFHFQLGRALWMTQRYDEAVDHLSIAAEADHTAAFSYLGDAYKEGLGGLPRNEKRATSFYEAAAEGGMEVAEEVVGILEEEAEKATFTRAGFQEPDIIEGLYAGDFSRFPTNHGPFAIDMYLMALHGYFSKDFDFLQQELGQNPAACGLLWDPALDQALTNKVMFENNPLWGNEADPMKQGMQVLGSLAEMLGKMQKPGGMQELMNEGIYGAGGMNMETLKKKAVRDALTLGSRYGCESDITIQIYKNIRPYVYGQPGFAPITNKRLAQNLTEGCYAYVGDSYKTDGCDCALNTILKSRISEDDQELLAASFSPRRIKRMKQKYPQFSQKIASCGIN